MKAGKIVEEELGRLPENLKILITGDSELAMQLYHEASYIIIDQYKKREFDSVEWRDLLELTKLGHYDLDDNQIQEALEFYNLNTELKQYDSIDQVEHQKGEAI